MPASWVQEFAGNQRFTEIVPAGSRGDKRLAGLAEIHQTLFKAKQPELANM